MGLRYRKSVKLGKGSKFNINKNSFSITTGIRGLHHTINSSQERTTSFGIPGTGLSFVDRRRNKRIPEDKRKRGNCLTYVLCFFTLIIILFSYSSGKPKSTDPQGDDVVSLWEKIPEDEQITALNTENEVSKEIPAGEGSSENTNVTYADENVADQSTGDSVATTAPAIEPNVPTVEPVVPIVEPVVPTTEPEAPTTNVATRSTGDYFNTYNNVEQQNTSETWVLNTKRLKIHRPGCRDVPKISSENYATSSESLETLQSWGYTTCGHCFN